MSTDTLFDAEEKTIEKADSLIKNKDFEANTLLPDFIELLKNYRKLYKQSRRLIKLSDKQQQRLSHAIEEADRAKKLAEAANKAKSDFLTNVSHEFRTPMNGILVSADLIQNEDISSRVTRHINTIRTSGHALLNIINDIIDFTKVESGQLTIEPRQFQMMHVFDTVIQLYLKQIIERRIEIIINFPFDFPQTIESDDARLIQILSNIIDNSIKFSNEFNIINIVLTIEADKKIKQNQTVNLKCSIQDNGIGISEESLPLIFEPFFQVDSSTTRKYEGTGMGLTITKKLIEAMGGHISVLSTEGQGATMEFNIPIKVVEQKKSDAYDEAISVIDGLKCLVIDDCHESRTHLLALLNYYNIDTQTLSSGHEAIEILQKYEPDAIPFDFIIIDWMMPQMDGIDTIIKIRNELGLRIPILLATPMNEENLKLEIQQIGINGILSKPVIPFKLAQAVCKMMSIPAQPVNDSHKTNESDNAHKKNSVEISEDRLTNDTVKNGLEPQIENASPDNSVEISTITPILNELYKALENANPVPIRECIEKCQHHIKSTKFVELIDRVENYEYEDALELLKKIMKKMGIET